MDPTANLKELLDTARRTITASDLMGRSGSDVERLADEMIDSADRMAELVVALNDWIVSGGFLPKQWSK